MKLQKTAIEKKHRVDVGFIAFITRTTALLIIALGMSLLARASDTSGLPVDDYPNAIRVTAGDINSMMVGEDPYGILNDLSLYTGPAFIGRFISAGISLAIR